MRILLSFPHPLGAPGIGWTAWNQVDSLVRGGHEVHVVAASIARPVPGAASVTTTLAAGGLRVPHRAIGRDRAFAWHDKIAAHRVRSTALDVVHLWPLSPGRTAEAARESGVASVREAPNTHIRRAWQAVDSELALLGMSEGDRTAHTEDPAHLAMEESELAAAAAVLAPSDRVRESFIAEGFAPDRVLRHRYGYRPGHRIPLPRSAEARGLRAVYVGLGEPRKGLHHALAAWRRSQASDGGTFTIVGRMLPSYVSALGDALRAPGVVQVGFSSDVEAALASADVLVLPSVEEGSALVTYEAQAMGCVPLVSTAAGAVLDDGVHGLLHDPGDVATLAAQFDLLTRNRGELARLSRSALDHAPSLTWDAAAEVLVDAYRAAMLLADDGNSHAHAA